MTLEIEQGKAYLYPEPLEEYLAYKEEQLQMAKRYNKKIEREKRHLQDFVDRFRYKASKATQAQSKLKQIAKLKTMDIAHPLSNVRIRLPQVENRKGLALRVNELSIGYNQKIVAKDISFDIDRGEHVAIVGDNGQGKTTFLKTIAEELPPLYGSFRWGTNIKIGYYAQHVPSMLKPEDQVQKYLERLSPPETKKEQILEMAGNFLFHDDDLNKTVSILSGGEKARLCLAGLLLQKNQVLLLDEPTNHLDFETVEALALALKNCNSTIIFISHNRTFVNEVATGIIEIKNGAVRRYLHNYEEYVYHLEKELGIEILNTPEQNNETDKDAAIKPINKEEAERLHAEMKAAKRNLQEIEFEIMELEKEKLKLLRWFEKNAEKYSREKTEKLHWTEEKLSLAEETWLKKQAEIEKLALALRGAK
jgi:ATP-binding cassette subfamily F protein 3